MVKPIEARFVCSALLPEQFPPPLRKEIAFVGRSNVGKSSLLNALLGRKDLAKISSKPGKTRTINFFEVEDKWYFVDLPGYGFAKVAKSVVNEWRRRMVTYLNERQTLCLVIVLLDSRHTPTSEDLLMLELLEDARRPTLIVTTKVDKLDNRGKVKHINTIRDYLELDEEALIIPTSSTMKRGLKEVWEIIKSC